jgi:glycosyltransferase involved in cell wall biosynthesis
MIHNSTDALRITLVNYTLSMMRGGGETRDLAFARHLTELGCDVTLVSVDPWFGAPRHPIHDFRSRLLRSPYWRDLVYRFMVLPKTGRLAAYLLRQDVKQFSRRVVELVGDPAYPVDVVQAAGLYPVVEVKKRRDVAVVIRNQGGLPPAWQRPFVPSADAIIGDGWDAQHYEAAIGRPLVEIAGGVDTELFRPLDRDAARAAVGLGDHPVFLYVGRFVPLKNIPMLIRGFKRIHDRAPSSVLLMAGEGALESQIRAGVSRLGLGAAVRFLGQQPQSALPQLYAAADVVLLTSSFDNSPNAVLEANACERPVVATSVGGVPRYVTTGENGLLVPHDDDAALADETLRLLADVQTRREMGSAGRARVLQRHSWRRSAEMLLALYRELLSRPM